MGTLSTRKRPCLFLGYGALCGLDKSGVYRMEAMATLWRLPKVFSFNSIAMLGIEWMQGLCDGQEETLGWT